MDTATIVRRLHEVAAEHAALRDKTPRAGAAPDESFLAQYNFNSIDALEFLLTLEEEFDIVIEDEDLSEELLESPTLLAEYIVRRRSSEAS